LSDKIKCLGKKHVIENDRYKATMELAELSVIDFNNYSIYRDSIHSAQFNSFVTWVEDNHNSTFYAQLIRNCQSGQAILTQAEGINEQIQILYKRSREVCMQAADSAVSSAQRAILTNEYEDIKDNADQLINNSYYNGQHIFLPSNVTDSGGESPAANGGHAFVFQVGLDGLQGSGSATWPLGPTRIRWTAGSHWSRNAVATAAYANADVDAAGNLSLDLSDHSANAMTQAEALAEVGKVDLALTRLQTHLQNMNSTNSDLRSQEKNNTNAQDVTLEALEEKRKDTRDKLEGTIQALSRQIEYLQVCIND